MLRDDLSNFAYLSNWTGQLEALAKMAIREPWTFRGPPDTQRPNYILDRYLRSIFHKQALEHLNVDDPIERDRALVVRHNCAVLNTGLQTQDHQDVYMYFDKVNRPGVMQEFTLRGFVNDSSKLLQKQEHLRWNMDNVFVRTDPAGNIKVDKEKSTEKIDGVVALIMALDRALKNGISASASVYDLRGLITL